MRKPNSAFTLIEGLLIFIVFGVLMLLSLSRMPIFASDVIRSKISRVKADHRDLGLSLVDWKAKHGDYPPPRPFVEFGTDGPALAQSGGASIGGWPVAKKDTAASGPDTLPPASDPFAPNGLPYAYAANATDWVLLSPGPDLHYDLEPRDWLDRAGRARLVDFTYDPTNGTTSGGDLVRVGPDVAAATGAPPQGRPTR